jgi:hypothetical protein
VPANAEVIPVMLGRGRPFEEAEPTSVDAPPTKHAHDHP